MTGPTDREGYSIDLAFGVLEAIAGEINVEIAADLHLVRAGIFGHLRNANPRDPHLIIRATGLTVKLVFEGIRRKREMGENNDTFHHGRRAEAGEAAYECGQRLVRWNRLEELRWVNRLSARKGPLTRSPPDEVCRIATLAFDDWTDRELSPS